MKNRLLESIGEQLNIPRKNLDSICQIVYSVAGQMALASLWDQNEEHDKVSVKHFKHRIVKIFDAYTDLYPEINAFIPNDKTVLADGIYSVYLHNGFMYHSSNWLSPAALAEAVSDNIRLVRGASPGAKLFMSGLGFYSTAQHSSDRSVANLFGLQEQSAENYLDELLSSNDWKEITWPENTEYLRLDPPFTISYWQQKPNYDDRISLARFGEPNRIYSFYRYQDGVFQYKIIPEWRIKDYFTNEVAYGGYRRIAVALLMRYGTLPEIKAKDTGNMLDIRVGYRLPLPEEYFFRLYSWPIRYDFAPKEEPVFFRKMSKRFYPVFKKELSSMGYRFVEE